MITRQDPIMLTDHVVSVANVPVFLSKLGYFEIGCLLSLPVKHLSRFLLYKIGNKPKTLQVAFLLVIST